MNKVDFMEGRIEVRGHNFGARAIHSHLELFLKPILLVKLQDLTVDRGENAIFFDGTLRKSEVPDLGYSKSIP